MPGFKEELHLKKKKPALLFNPGPVWGAWTNWTSCSATCGTGSQQRMRTCVAGACVGHTTESQACTGPICESFASVVLVLRTIFFFFFFFASIYFTRMAR